MPSPSGEQFEIVSGSTRATITEVGATLRTFDVGGRAVVWGFGSGQMCSGGRGQVLAPWPNRLARGTYSFGNRSGRAPIDEPDLDNAIHGLVRWLPWEVTRSGESAVSCSVRLAAQPAYPWWLRLQVDYSVSEGALTVETTAENLGDELAPFALGFHPYLAAGPGGLDRARLTLPARRRLLTDERKLPRGSEAVPGSPLDALASGIDLSGLALDDAFTAIDCGTGRRWRALLVPAGAAPVALWADAVFSYAMCFTGDTLPVDERRRGIAIEPMTAPPNALATGDGVIALARWAPFTAAWGIEAG